MAQKTESQPYELIEKYENIEIRYYPPAIKVMSKGKIGGNKNFRNLLITYLVQTLKMKRFQ